MITIMVIYAFAPVPSYAWDDCPFGLVDDPYPGDCPRYVDTNGDGLCDHSQESQGDNDSSEDMSVVSDNAGVTQEESMTGEPQEGGVSNNNEKSAESPYNFPVPFFSSILLYLITWFLTRMTLAGKRKLFARTSFNFIWNTVLVLSTIPSVVFGFYLVLRYSYPRLREVDFDFLYWHVEGAIVFGTVAVMHLITRLRQYIAPLKFRYTRAG